MGASLPILFPTGYTGWKDVHYFCSEPVWVDELAGAATTRASWSVARPAGPKALTSPSGEQTSRHLRGGRSRLTRFARNERDSTLRKRPGNVPVRARVPGKTRWVPGHAVWIHDVLAYRASPAAWKEFLVWVTGAEAREPTAEEAKKLHRLGDDRVVAVLKGAGGGTIEIAARAESRDILLGPYADAETGRGEQTSGMTSLATSPAGNRARD